ncbi:BRO family protein [Hoyosella altamirensis]|uniref:Prophage antirepressor-like protein n=1 Tax=Hoyosella altamirensis TaxID=616997 RepID=A0A839RTU9_9ACTN|nr:BRO family protein [Hoyosella altamirensis]MBB3039990.1 prophage antirepressor-like protein [Hoyosella altamirensis]
MTDHTSQIVPFQYEGAQLRTVVIDGEPWFVAPDACRMLTLRDVTSALKMVDHDDKQTLRRSDTPHMFEGIAPQVQLVTVVNESGMYALIFQSEKEEARKIRRWLTREVLPEIRKTGSYGSPSLPDISTPSGVLAMSEMFNQTAKQLVAATEQNQMMAAQIRNDAPKVAKAEAHTASTSSIHRQGFAREVQAWGIKTGVKINHEQVYAFLRHKGMLIDGDRSDRNHATSTAVKNGWAWTEKGTTENGRDYFVTRLYPKGQDIAWKWITGFIDANGHLELPRRIGAAS